MEGFRIDLKTSFSLAMPNQYSLIVRMSWFWSIYFGARNPRSLYIVLLYYMISADLYSNSTTEFNSGQYYFVSVAMQITTLLGSV